MNGWLLVEQAALAGDEQLQVWVDRGVAFVRTLPPKLPQARPSAQRATIR